MKSSLFIIPFLIVLIMKNVLVECEIKMDINGLREMVKPMSKSCKRKTKVSDELVEGTHNGEFPLDRSLMCYFNCISIMLKLMSKQGDVDAKSIEKQIDLLTNEQIAPRIKEVARLCYNKVERKEDSCEYAFEFAICIYTIDKSTGVNMFTGLRREREKVIKVEYLQYMGDTTMFKIMRSSPMSFELFQQLATGVSRPVKTQNLQRRY